MPVQDEFSIIGMDKIREIAVEKHRFRIADQGAHGRIYHDASSFLGNDDCLVDIIHEKPVFFLALAECFFTLLERGDIDDRSFCYIPAGIIPGTKLAPELSAVRLTNLVIWSLIYPCSLMMRAISIRSSGFS